MTGIRFPETQWYASRLAAIPNVLDRAWGQRRCRQLGGDIFERHGYEGMIVVCECVRDHIDGTLSRAIEAAWDGIGPWLK